MIDIEYRKYQRHILDYMNENPEKLKRVIEGYLEYKESKGTLRGALNLMCEYGCFDRSYDQAMDTLKKIYGDKFDESKYITKNKLWKIKNKEVYIWTVYKAKLARTIEIMEKKGELW